MAVSKLVLYRKDVGLSHDQIKVNYPIWTRDLRIGRDKNTCKNELLCCYTGGYGIWDASEFRQVVIVAPSS